LMPDSTTMIPELVALGQVIIIDLMLRATMRSWSAWRAGRLPRICAQGEF